jgi:uncharacterized protein (TIGR00290 family)
LSEKVIVGWSGGKDSALALFEVMKSGMEVMELLTTILKEEDRISVHGVRRILLEQQAEALGLPLEKMLISKDASNIEYEQELLALLRNHGNNRVLSVVFGDIFLEDVKRYRDEMLAKIDMHGVYPLWGRNTRELAEKFIDLGFKAVVTVVDSNVLGKEFAGREFDKKFLPDLPTSVDPCGEKGEFHTFVYNGPIFSKPVKFSKGEVTFVNNRFWHCDILPEGV